MVDTNKSEIVCILDRSGSMGSIWGDMMGGLKSFVEDQKKEPGQANITMIVFDHEYREIISSMDIHKFDVDKAMSDVLPRGTTALYDAVGRSIQSLGEYLNRMKEEERPGNVIFCIITDGLENASKEYSAKRVKEMLEHQKDKYSWIFTYLGANQDAFAVGQMIGISKSFCANIDADAIGAQAAYSASSSIVGEVRTRGAAACCASASSMNLDEIYRQHREKSSH